MENGRTCKRCQLLKSSSEFEKLKRNKSGYRVICNACRILEVKTNTKTSILSDRPPEGIVLELKLVPHERFWQGFNRLIDMIVDDLLKERKKK